MPSYTELIERTQSEVLTALRQAQDLNVKTLASLTELVSSIPLPTGDVKNVELPTATEVVEHTFAFTNKFMEVRKEYMVKLAELATAGQKQFAEAAQRMTEAVKN